MYFYDCAAFAVDAFWSTIAPPRPGPAGNEINSIAGTEDLAFAAVVLVGHVLW